MTQVTAEWIASLRKSLNLSREAFAQRCGPPMTASKVWAVETGKRSPRPDELACLQRLGVDSDAAVINPLPIEPSPPPLPQEPPVSPLPTEVVARVFDVPTELLEQEVEENPEIPPWAIQDGARRVSNSEVQTFKECRRKWWLGWYRSLKLTEEMPVEKRHSGNRVHDALRAWYVPPHKTPTDPREALERAIVRDWTTLNSGQFPPSVDTVNKFKTLIGLERAMIEGYMEHLAETGIDNELIVTAPETYLEAPVEVPYVNRDFRIIGKIDVRVRRILDGVRLFVDHKTVDSINARIMMLPLDEQMLHYHVLEWLTTAEGESRCDGALYNMLRRVKRTARAQPPFYDRIEVRHNIHELENFKTRLLATLGDMQVVENALDQGISHHEVAYPTPSNDCTWKCEFFAICPMFNDGSRIEDLISQYYRVADPLEYYKTAIQDQEGAGT